jgi:site-specific DNA-methyltransferase (adenine-specific)
MGGALDKHYNRTESKVLGYVEVAARDYATFSAQWIREAARVLKPGACTPFSNSSTRLRTASSVDGISFGTTANVQHRCDC